MISNVLLVYPAMIPSVLLCGKLQLEWLAQRGEICFQSVQRERLTSQLSGWADIVFLVRSDSFFEFKMSEKWKKSGKYLAYVLDDDLLDVPGYIASAEHYRRPETVQLIKSIMNNCSCLISPSKKLLEKYGVQFQKTIQIEEPATVQCVDKLKQTGPIKLGFAGSVDRANEVDTILQGALNRLLCHYGPRISVEFFGAKPKIVDQLSLKHIPYCDSYEAYLKTIKALNWEIGLAPLPSTEFHSCKHYNKYIEYAACGIAGVYSDVEPYRSIIRNEKNGLLCKNTVDAWYQALSLLIENQELRNRISKHVAMEAHSRFSLAETAHGLQIGMEEIFKNCHKSKKIYCVTWLHLRSIFYRALLLCKTQGLKTPMVIITKLKKLIY